MYDLAGGVISTRYRKDLLRRAAGGDWVLVTDPSLTAPEKFCQRIAAHGLEALGLVELLTVVRVRQERRAAGDFKGFCAWHAHDGRLLCARMTPLGKTVTRFFARHFDAGRQVRWSEFFAAVESGRVRLPA